MCLSAATGTATRVHSRAIVCHGQQGQCEQGRGAWPDAALPCTLYMLCFIAEMHMLRLAALAAVHVGQGGWRCRARARHVPPMSATLQPTNTTTDHSDLYNNAVGM